MIGGVDLIIPVHAPEQAIESVCHLVRSQFWPQAVVEDATTGVQVSLSRNGFGEFSPAYTEILIYRDRQTARQWRECGAVPGSENTMIHLIGDRESITIVVDDPCRPEMRGLVDAVIELVRDEVFQVEAIA